jgi:hypothetical protein
VNLPRDIVELQMLRNGVKQDQVRLKMKGGMKRAAAMVFLPDQVAPSGLQGRADDRGQMRFVIDQEDALGKFHSLG